MQNYLRDQLSLSADEKLSPSFIESTIKGNMNYYDCLLSLYNGQAQNVEEVQVLHDPHAEQIKNITNQKNNTCPTQIIPSPFFTSLLKKEIDLIPLREVRDSHKNNNDSLKQKPTITYAPLNAGIGTSILRDEYRRYIKDTYSYPHANLGSKASDLFIPPSFFPDQQTCSLSLAEFKWVSFIKNFCQHDFEHINLMNLVSPSTYVKLESLWDTPLSHLNNKSIKDFARGHNTVRLMPPLMQTNMAALDEKNQPQYSTAAPAGHGYFIYHLLSQLLMEDELTAKKRASEFGIFCISNGEDLNALPTPEIVKWIHQTQSPITMLFTEKTHEDIKGGQLALRRDQGSAHFTPTIIEYAQGKHLYLEEEFKIWGLQNNHQKSLFNTNMVFINLPALLPLLKKLKAKTNGTTSFLAPDLIIKKKHSLQANKTYTLLEGAMGTIFLNLAKQSKDLLNVNSLKILAIDKEHRSEFFTPLKSNEDYYRYFYSGQYQFDSKNYRMILNPNYQSLKNEKLPSTSDIYTFLKELNLI